jgi:hypothetical protein
VRDLTRDDGDERLIRGIVGMAREFDQITIAEGIEDEATLVRLRDLGVNLGQGYLFGRPAPLADQPATIRRPEDEAPGSDPVTLVRRAFEAFAAGDFATTFQLFVPPRKRPSSPVATSHTGGMRSWSLTPMTSPQRGRR